MTFIVYPANLTRLTEEIDSRSSASHAPLIGISANFREGNSMICNTYVQSILLAGGMPMLLPVHTDIEVLKEAISRLDGLLLSGGGDINPLYGGENPIPALQEVDAARDQYDFTLVKLAADRQIPIFGICRGHQVINMAFGGSNYQDIYTQRPGETLKHSQSINREYGSHTVQVVKDSTLYSILGEEEIVVNSFHHQAVREVAEGFRVTATSPDGIIEAMEATPHYPIFSVQWHPEKMAPLPDERMLTLFRHFTAEATLFKKAKAIHQAYPIIDSHCDTPMKFTEEFDIGKRNQGVKVDLPKMQEGRVDGCFMVAYLPQGKRDEEGFQKVTQDTVEIFYQLAAQVTNHQDNMGFAYTSDDLLRLKRQGRKAIFLGIENGYALGKEIGNLAQYKEMGVSYITLCHNGDNDICDSSEGGAAHNGLSPFGREVVREMNRLGILIDISHASEKTVYDVLEESVHPIIASHSSARALRDHPRNLTDDQIQAIAARGGVIQVCLYNHFLSKSLHPTLQDAVNHINHIVKLAGINHVGIGSDFDGDDTEVLTGCRATNELINLTVALLRQGYSPEELGKLWGGNLLRVLDQVQGKSLFSESL